MNHSEPRRPRATPAQVAYTWPEIQDLCVGLHRGIVQRRVDPTVVICVLRGGAVPGVLLAHLFDAKAMHAVRGSTMRDERPRVRRARATVEGVDGLPDLADDVVLLVDDVSNTGETLTVARNQIMNARRPRLLLTACLVWDTVGVEGEVLVDCAADLHADAVHAWVRFPWEIRS